MIERPRPVIYDWHGTAGCEPKSGDYLRSPAGSVWWIQSSRQVKVKVDRGQTLRLCLGCVRWPPDEVPADAKVYRIHWTKRAKKRRAWP